MVSRDGRKDVRHAKTERFCEEFLESNPGASSHALLRAVNNAHLDPVPYLIDRIFKEHLERKGKKTNATPAMLSMQIHPASPEQQAIADVVKQLRLVMDRHAIESCILSLTTSPSPHVDVDIDYKKASKWSLDL